MYKKFKLSIMIMSLMINITDIMCLLDGLIMDQYIYRLTKIEKNALNVITESFDEF